MQPTHSGGGTTRPHHTSLFHTSRGSGSTRSSRRRCRARHTRRPAPRPPWCRAPLFSHRSPPASISLPCGVRAFGEKGGDRLELQAPSLAPGTGASTSPWLDDPAEQGGGSHLAVAGAGCCLSCARRAGESRTASVVVCQPASCFVVCPSQFPGRLHRAVSLSVSHSPSREDAASREWKSASCPRPSPACGSRTASGCSAP